MFRQFYIGATGMDALEKDIMTITNNVANSKTVGYKKSRVEMENLFPQVLSEAMNNLEEGTTQPAGVELGSGVRVTSTPKDMKQGQIESTDNPYDLAIQGDGFIAVRMQDDTLAYTRAGNFNRDAEGNMVDPNGHILDDSIVVPNDASSIRISQDGRVFVRQVDDTTESELGQISVWKFRNPEGLTSIGQNLFIENQSTGEPLQGIAGQEGYGTISQYSLELSNVDIVEEMMKMIVTQRAFDVISKSIQTGEGMMRSATDMVRS